MSQQRSFPNLHAGTLGRHCFCPSLEQLPELIKHKAQPQFHETVRCFSRGIFLGVLAAWLRETCHFLTAWISVLKLQCGQTVVRMRDSWDPIHLVCKLHKAKFLKQKENFSFTTMHSTDKVRNWGLQVSKLKFWQRCYEHLMNSSEKFLFALS